MAQHVFVGDIAGPDLTAHCVDQFELFAKECLTDELSPFARHRHRSPPNVARAILLTQIAWVQD